MLIIIFRNCSYLAEKTRKLALTYSITCGRTKATDGPSQQFLHPLPSSVRRIPMSELQVSKECFGKGVFGKCYSARLGHLEVCAKVFRHEQSLPNEAYILSLCCHENIPWIYGVNLNEKTLIMSFHGIRGGACTLHKLLRTQKSQDCFLKLQSTHCQSILHGLISALKYLHSKNILHNDIKCDNVAIESCSSDSEVKSVLIDFGKACLVSAAKSYDLTMEDKTKYAKHHPQIAPDLRDGKCKQSVYSDVYSFGRVLKIINQEGNIHLPVLTNLGNMCTVYSSTNRPTAVDLSTFLSNLFE